MSFDPDTKYIVFDRGTFYEMMTRLVGATATAEVQEAAEYNCLVDAVVIRTKDRFAGPALHAYASAISIVTQTLMEAAHPGMDEAGETVTRESLLRLAGSLRPAADYLHSRAVEADAIAHAGNDKLPD